MVWSHFPPCRLISRSPDEPVDRPYVSFMFFSQCPTVVTGLTHLSVGFSKGALFCTCVCAAFPGGHSPWSAS